MSPRYQLYQPTGEDWYTFQNGRRHYQRSRPERRSNDNVRICVPKANRPGRYTHGSGVADRYVSV